MARRRAMARIKGKSRTSSAHHVSESRATAQAVRNTVAVVLAGGRGSRLKQLTDWRAKPAVAFGGKFRIIDFTLSNCINSGIRRIDVCTQYKAHSLIRHVQRGWNFLDGRFDEFVEVIPAQQRTDGRGRITAFQEKPRSDPYTVPGDATKVIASMGIYLFDAAFLFELLGDDAPMADSCHDFGKDLIPRCVNGGVEVYAHDFHSS